MVFTWCYYNNDSTNGSTYGKLYNAYAVMDPRGLAPAGWHIPTDSEWLKMENCLGGKSVAGGKMMAVSNLWITQNVNATNESNFSALPNGIREGVGHKYSSIGSVANWWTSTDGVLNGTLNRYISGSNLAIYSTNYNKKYGQAVRCVKD